MTSEILEIVKQLTNITTSLRGLSSKQEIVMCKEEIIKLLEYANNNSLEYVQINSLSGPIGVSLKLSDPQQKSPTLDITNYDNW